MDQAAHARSLCECGGWADLLEFTLDWQMENPGDARAFFYRGVALTASGQAREAEASYRRALQLDPKDFKTWNNLATLLFEALDRPMEGVQCLAHALKQEPRNKLGWANLASMSGQLGRHAQALECAERALAIDPEFVEPHLHRARAAQALGKTEIVRAACAALAQLPPEKFARAR
jgi:Tfp pilus assembly protein PilF